MTDPKMRSNVPLAASGVLSRYTWQQAIWAALAFGVLLRLIHFGFGRMLWLDEAMLALNLDVRSGAELMQPLDYQQIAPVGWLFVVDWISGLFNDYAYASRLPALVAGVATLFLVSNLAQKLFALPVTFIVTLTVSLSYLLIYYSAELKPYGFDALLWAGAATLAWRLHVAGDDAQTKAAVWLSAIFVVGAPFAFAAPAIIGGIGGVLILQYGLARNYRIAGILAVGSALSAAIYLTLALMMYQTQVDAGGMNDGGMGHYFNRMFAPFPPTSLGDLVWYPKFVDSTMGGLFGVESAYLVLTLAIVGAWTLFRDRFWTVALFASPTIMAAFLSIAHVYPILPRLALFFIPILIVLSGYALDTLLRRFEAHQIAFVVAVCICLNMGSLYLSTYNKLYSPVGSDKDMSREMAILADRHEANDLIAVGGFAVPAYLLYRDAYGLKDAAWTIVDTTACLAAAHDMTDPEGNLWLLQSQWGGINLGLGRDPNQLFTRLDGEVVSLEMENVAKRLKRFAGQERSAVETAPETCTYGFDVSPYLNGGSTPTLLPTH